MTNKRKNLREWRVDTLLSQTDDTLSEHFSDVEGNGWVVAYILPISGMSGVVWKVISYRDKTPEK